MVYRITAGLGSPICLLRLPSSTLNVMIARLFIAALLMPVINKSYIRVYYLGYWATGYFPGYRKQVCQNLRYLVSTTTDIRRLPTMYTCMHVE